MKNIRRINPVFLGECIVIIALLCLIAYLIPIEKTPVMGKERDSILKEDGEALDMTAEEAGGTVQYARDILAGGSADSISANNAIDTVNSVSGNDIANTGNSVSGNDVADGAASISENSVTNAADSVSENSAAGEGMDTFGTDVLSDGELNIAVFADSIWNQGRGTNGISEKLEERLGANVYNCSIGGNTAAIVSEPTDVTGTWTSYSVNGLMYVARGEASAEEFLNGTPAYKEIKEADFSKMDYLIIAYGLNDYFSDVEIYPKDMYDMTTYVGALRHAVTKMKETFPHMKIILIGPTYCGMFADSHRDSLEMYSQAAAMVAEEYGTYYLDMYHGLGINQDNQSIYLSDGVHLSEEGRVIYADKVVGLIEQTLQEDTVQ